MYSGISGICVKIKRSLFPYLEHFERVCASAKFIFSEMVWSVNVVRQLLVAMMDGLGRLFDSHLDHAKKVTKFPK